MTLDFGSKEIWQDLTGLSSRHKHISSLKICSRVFSYTFVYQSSWSFLCSIAAVNVCAEKQPCKNGGECENKEDDYTCKCKAGFTGTNCERSKLSVFKFASKVWLISGILYPTPSLPRYYCNKSYLDTYVNTCLLIRLQISRKLSIKV